MGLDDFSQPEAVEKNTGPEKREANVDRGALWEYTAVIFANVQEKNGIQKRTITYSGRQYQLAMIGKRFEITSKEWTSKLMFVFNSSEGWGLSTEPKFGGSISSTYHVQGQKITGSAKGYSHHAKNALRILKGGK